MVSRRTTMVLADEALSIKQIARQLDACWIVEGSLRSSDGGLMLGLNLIDGQDEHSLHATHYTLDPDDEAAIPGSIESFMAQITSAAENERSR